MKNYLHTECELDFTISPYLSTVTINNPSVIMKKLTCLFSLHKHFHGIIQ